MIQTLTKICSVNHKIRSRAHSSLYYTKHDGVFMSDEHIHAPPFSGRLILRQQVHKTGQSQRGSRRWGLKWRLKLFELKTVRQKESKMKRTAQGSKADPFDFKSDSSWKKGDPPSLHLSTTTQFSFRHASIQMTTFVLTVFNLNCYEYYTAVTSYRQRIFGKVRRGSIFFGSETNHGFARTVPTGQDQQEAEG